MMTISRNTAVARENRQELKENSETELSQNFYSYLPEYCRFFEILNWIYQREVAWKMKGKLLINQWKYKK